MRLPPLAIGLYLLTAQCLAQSRGDEKRSLDSAYTQPVETITRNLLRDQKRVWTSPSRIRAKDLAWIAPLAGTTAFLLASDERNMRERFHTNTQGRDRSLRVSNLGLGALAAVPAYLSWYGWKHSDEYAQESAILSARAASASLISAQLINLLTRRETPIESTGAGRFYHSGSVSSSFPSMHAAAAWAIAPVIAERYPGWLTKVGVYGLASAVTLSRLQAREHFPSDLLVGSALGWLVGHSMANPHGSDHGRPAAYAAPSQESSAGSVSVPTDSWIYPALDRLAALGLIPTQTASLRPWTRAECRRQLDEAEEGLELLAGGPDASAARAAAPLLTALRREFAQDEPGVPKVVLEAVSLRAGVIAGPVLNDSYHFGQTWINDFGRPFGRGWSGNAGFRLRAESGRFFAYYRGEYQHAPSAPAYSLAVRQVIATLDSNPLREAESGSVVNRFRVLEAYAGVRLGNFEFSAGKQAMWYGPTYDAPLSFSSNAEPTKNARISMVHPYRLPGFLRVLGEVRGELVMGKLGGHSYTWRPWFNSAKLTFKVTENLELGFTRWSILWGVGHPITLKSFARNVFSFASTGTDYRVGDSADPGDRKAGFDFRYRIPGLRDWVTLYSDSYSDDDPSPLAAPRRAAISPGILLTRVPRLPNLSLRAEATSTAPLSGDYGGTFIYFNNQYHSGNTNYGNLLGSWVGRDGRALQGWATYWFSARSKVEAGYRQTKTGTRFLPGGGTQTAATLKGSYAWSNHLYFDLMLQYERFFVPVLGGPQRNLSGWLQLTWEPGLRLQRK
ncbi:capsule assembly Wzi family protein [uncultured Paludibaculum sp.]|uniref:capsule assembly Wzi family protein n=1 Tax=uncultured Paludibaculum sp. TaxID=1765020 RepID=UPI002AAB3C04|nr:capsule assembly Wzi family protein [uncultured Paludibaculum sp.]